MFRKYDMLGYYNEASTELIKGIGKLIYHLISQISPDFVSSDFIILFRRDIVFF